MASRAAIEFRTIAELQAELAAIKQNRAELTSSPSDASDGLASPTDGGVPLDVSMKESRSASSSQPRPEAASGKRASSPVDSSFILDSKFYESRSQPTLSHPKPLIHAPPTTFETMDSPGAPPQGMVHLPDQTETFARLDRELKDARRKAGYLPPYIEDEDDVEEGDNGGYNPHTIDRDNMVGKGRPGTGTWYFDSHLLASELNDVEKEDFFRTADEDETFKGEGVRIKLKVGVPEINEHGHVEKGKGTWEEENGTVGGFMEGEYNPDEVPDRKDESGVEASKQQEIQAERMPFVVESSKRLQAVLGMRNDLLFELPTLTAPERQNLRRLSDGSLDRNSLPLRVKSLYAPPGMGDNFSLNDLPRAGTQFDLSKLPENMRGLYALPPGMIPPGFANPSMAGLASAPNVPSASQHLFPQNAGQSVAGADHHATNAPQTASSVAQHFVPKVGAVPQKAYRVKSKLGVPGTAAASQSQAPPASSSFSTTEQIPSRNVPKGRPSPISPMFGVHVDPKTGKGLREWLLAKGKEFGMRKRECSMISFHDMTRCLMSNTYRDIMIAQYGAEGNGERVDVYEIELPTTTKVPGTDLVIPHKQPWIWFLISRPVLSLNPQNTNTDPSCNHRTDDDENLPDEYMTAATFQSASSSSASSYQPAPFHASPPPNFPNPIPTSWVVFACPLENITAYPEKVLTIERPRPTTSNPYYPRHHGNGSSFNSQGSNPSDPIDLDPPSSPDSEFSRTLSEVGRKVHKRKDFDFSHNGLPIFEFSTNSSQFMGSRTQFPPREFLSVSNIGGFYPGDTYLPYPTTKYTANFLRWRGENKHREEKEERGEWKVEGEGLGREGKGRDRSKEVPCVYAGVWWWVWCMGMWDDVWAWEKIRGAMGRGKCRVVVKWIDWEKGSETSGSGQSGAYSCPGHPSGIKFRGSMVGGKVEAPESVVGYTMKGGYDLASPFYRAPIPTAGTPSSAPLTGISNTSEDTEMSDATPGGVPLNPPQSVDNMVYFTAGPPSTNSTLSEPPSGDIEDPFKPISTDGAGGVGGGAAAKPKPKPKAKRGGKGKGKGKKK